MPDAVIGGARDGNSPGAAASQGWPRLELDLFLEGLLRGSGLDLRGYRVSTVQAGVQACMRTEGVATVTQLLERYLHFPESRRRILGNMLVTQSGFFRQPPTTRALRAKVVPLLRTYPTLKVWLVGSGTGQEAYSLAIVLREEGLLARTRLYVSDPSEAALDVARAGRYPAAEVEAAEAAYREGGGHASLAANFAIQDGEAQALPDLSAAMYFMQHGLATDHSPNEFQLIVCRHVLDLFEAPLRERAFHVLQASLAPFGVLSLGLDEVLADDRFQAVEPGSGLFRKVR